MPPSLDLCINDLFEPGNIPADPGIPPAVPTIPQIYDIAATFNGAGSLSSSGQLLAQPQSGAAQFTGTASLSAFAAIIGQRAVATFSGAGSLRANATFNLWTPEQLSSLQIWFRGDDLSGADQDLISTWTDASGNSRNATQATASNQPFLEVAELNSLNVVHFDPTTTERYMELSNLGGTGWTEGMIICVLKAGADPGSGTRGGPHYFGTATSTNHYPFSDNNIYNGDMSTVRKTVGNPASTLAAWRIFGTRSATNDWKFYLDGVQFFTTATNTVGFGVSRLGAGGGAGGFKFDGFIAEWTLFNVALAQSDREKVEGYLAHKWGITSVLDGGHPYKTNPPLI
jgi:hypothetical protein